MKESKTSNSQKAASRRYDDKTYSRITWRVPKGYNKELAERIAPESLNNFITNAVNEKLNGGVSIDIPDLDVYARSAGMTTAEYIKSAVEEKMQRQDKEYTETITREPVE